MNLEQVKNKVKILGVWNDEELENHENNLQRLFWLSCGNIVDML